MTVIFEVLRAALIKIQACRDVKLGILLIIYRRFWVACCLSVHGSFHSSIMSHYFYES